MDGDAILPSSPPCASPGTTPTSPFFERQTNAHLLKSSSPPPLFSSDDSRESDDIANYTSPRLHKKRKQAHWWDNGESTHHTPESKKIKFSRNYDSGVYMLSDATDSSESLFPLYKAPFGTDETPKEPSTINSPESNFNNLLRTGLERNLEVYEFRELDLEDGDIERVGDLASVIKDVPDPGSDLPAEGQYRSLEPELYINLGQNQLCRLTPSLFNIQFLTTLIMRNNLIEQLPQQISQLQNLKTLDVSLNKLKYLPFDILDLLRPYGPLERLTTMGNPLLEPMSSARFLSNPFVRNPLPALYYHDALPLDAEREEAQVHLPRLYKSLGDSSDLTRDVWRIRHYESWANSFGGGDDAHEDAIEKDGGVYEHHPSLDLDDVSPTTPKYLARTLVSYFDQAGNLLANSVPLPASNDEDYPVIIETNCGTYGIPSSPWPVAPSSSRIFSLVTSSLHFAFRHRHSDGVSIDDLREMVRDGYSAPLDADAILTRASENDSAGFGEFRSCHNCGREYVVARAEWVEFWSVGMGVFYPLRVQVCCWGCVPDGIGMRPSTILP